MQWVGLVSYGVYLWHEAAIELYQDWTNTEFFTGAFPLLLGRRPPRSPSPSRPRATSSSNGPRCGSRAPGHRACPRRRPPFNKGQAWLLLGLAVIAVVLYTVGIVVGSPLLILIGTVVTTALYFLVRSRAKRQATAQLTFSGVRTGADA